MKKVLFLLNKYKPGNLPNGICVEGIAQDLLHKGDKVYCISQTVDGKLHRENIDGVQVLRIREPFFDLAVRKLSKHPLLLRFSYLINNIKTLLFLPCWPMVSPFYCLHMFRAAKKMINEERIDVVVSVYTPIAALICGYLLKKSNPRLMYIAYFLDSLSGGVTPRFVSSKFVEDNGGRWERKLLSNADKIVIMKSHEEHFRKIHSNSVMLEKLVILDIPLYRPELYVNLELTEKRDCTVIAYVGSLQRRLKNPDYFLDIYDKLPPMGLELHFFGQSDCDELFNKYEFRNNRVMHHGIVAHDKVPEILVKATVLLNIGSRNDRQIPCKIFEYISAGKPIISTYISENEPSIPYIKRSANNLLIEEKEIKKTEAIRRVASYLSEIKQRGDSVFANEEEWRLNTPGSFSDLIEN